MVNENNRTYDQKLGLTAIGILMAFQGIADPTGLQPLSNPGIEALLKTKVAPQEDVQLISMANAELEPSLPGAETVVVWVMLGDTYWATNLSILSQQNGKWQSVATLSLAGAQPVLDTITTDGQIFVNAKTPAPNDAVCCPSQLTTLHFRYGKGRLVEDKMGVLKP